MSASNQHSEQERWRRRPGSSAAVGELVAKHQRERAEAAEALVQSLEEQHQTARDALVKIAEGPSDTSPPEIARCALGWPAHGWESGIYEQLDATRVALDRGAADYVGLLEQFDALRLVVTQQLTPLDVAARHIDIIRRKGDDYSAQERDNVASIVEAHVSEARSALFASISNPAKERP